MARSSAVRLFRYGDGFLAAENERGELVASIGSEPLYYPDAILEYCDREFEASVTIDGEFMPDPLPIEGTPYTSYQAFKEDWGKSKLFQLVRERRKQDAKIFWDIYTGRIEKMIIYVVLRLTVTAYESEAVQSFTLADPTLADIRIGTLGVAITGKKLGTTSYHAVFKDGRTADGYVAVVERQLLSPEKPTYGPTWRCYYAGTWEQQRRYNNSGVCAGPGTIAWANLYGWFDYTGRAPNLIEGTAPLYNNGAVRDCMEYVAELANTLCVMGSVTEFWFPLPYGYKWAKERGCGYSVHAAWGAPCNSSPSAQQLARDSIVIDGTPTIIGVGLPPHRYYVAFGYKFRTFTGPYGETWATERKFLCNMGFGADTPEWINASDVMYGQRNNFW